MSTEQRVLDVIASHLTDYGYPPSVRDLADTIGVAPSTVQHAIRTLEAKGRLVRVPGRARAIRVVPPSEASS